MSRMLNAARPQDGSGICDSHRRGELFGPWPTLCHAMFNLNEFLYLE